MQDQLSAAFGGISSITIDPYPAATVESLPAWPELSARLSLVSLGRPHRSSALHERVIEHVQGQPAPAFDRLRDAADAARAAVLGRDLVAFGAAMVANTDAQDALHPTLVGADARRTIDRAREHGALGWKVNGAGGDGGSVTFLSPTADAKVELEVELGAADPEHAILPVAISDHGLEIRSNAAEAPLREAAPVHLTWRADDGTLDRFRARAASEPLSYAEVGRSLDAELPFGYQHGRESVTIGTDLVAFAAGADGLRRWACHRAIGVRVWPADAPLDVDATVALALPVGPLRLLAACRIVRVIDEPDCFGFAYGSCAAIPRSVKRRSSCTTTATRSRSRSPGSGARATRSYGSADR